MEEKGWVSAKTVSALTGISVNNIYQQNSKNHKYIKRVENILGKENVVVNLDRLRYYRKFHRKIWLASHENYYEITSYISEYKLAHLLERYVGGKHESWATYMALGLFSMAWADRSLLHYKIPKLLYKFYRFTTLLIRRIKRREAEREQRILANTPNRDKYMQLYTEDQKKWFKIRKLK